MTGMSLKTILPDTLHCSVSLLPQQIDDFHLDLLIVQVRNLEDSDENDSILHVDIQDTTEGVSHPHAVYEYQGGDGFPGEVFSRQRPVCARSSELSSETRITVAQIDTRQLCFARQGVRHLLFRVTRALKDGSKVAESHDLIEYDNPSLGYLDWQENREQLRLQAVQFAGALMAQNTDSFSPGQHGLLRGWLLADIDLANVSTRGKRTFEKAFKRLLKVCRHTDLDQLITLGQEIESKSAVGQRQEIVEFCFHLIRLCEPLSKAALSTLQEIAAIWKIDATQFSVLLEKTFSINRLQDMDPMVLLGITEDMPAGQILNQLNKAYAKWNGRVTHVDKVVQRQAEDMLSWISHARGRYQSR